jgi:hypothetical protein
MLSFLCIPESLKPKVKEAFPEATFFVSEMDESTHGKPRKKREKKVEVKDNESTTMPPLSAVCSD